MACLVYAAIMYFARDQTCKSLGEPIQDDWDEPKEKLAPNAAEDVFQGYGKGSAQEMQLGQLYGAATPRGRPGYYTSPIYRSSAPVRYPAVSTIFPSGQGYGMSGGFGAMGAPGGFGVPGGPVRMGGAYGGTGMFENPIYPSGAQMSYEPAGVARPPYGRFGRSLPRDAYMMNPNQWY